MNQHEFIFNSILNMNNDIAHDTFERDRENEKTDIEDEEVEEIPQFKGTLEQLNNLTIKK
jgi:hypothetical protein